jgi:hypothetical protein
MPKADVKYRSVLSRFATPHTFGPDLSLGESLVAITASLSRIFGTCLLFATWGGFSALVWNAIENHFWRAAAVVPLVLVFLAALATLMLGISKVEKSLAPRR